MKNMQCTNCKSEILANAKFCPECGYKIENQGKICPNKECNRIGLPADALFCPDCGTVLSSIKKNIKNSIILGIDIGTTNTRFSIFKEGKPIILATDLGETFMPSVASITQNGEILFGTPAKRQSETNPINTVYSIKRCIGESYSNLIHETKTVPYLITHDDEDRILIQINGHNHLPEEISAVILREIKRIAVDCHGLELTDAVVTVPTCFNDSQRRATIRACEIARLNVRSLINETSAAALAYGFDKLQRDMTIAILHLGGGTFDFSILEIGDGLFEVKSTLGISQLGGTDFDQLIIDYLADDAYNDIGIDLRQDKWALPRLKEAAERAKIELSSSTYTEINLQYLSTVDGTLIHLVKVLTREKFEQLSDRLILTILEYCNKALMNAGISAHAIDEVLLVGGSTRIPMVREKIQQLFGKSPSTRVNPDEIVAKGAAIYGGVLSKEINEVLLLDVLAESIGIETVGGVMSEMIKSNTTIPTVKKEIFSTAEDNQKSVEIHVLQGEQSMAFKNKTIRRFHLDGIPMAKKGIPQIEVIFNIDQNGILDITATDKNTGKIVKPQYINK